jgi:hypothetical protein
MPLSEEVVLSLTHVLDDTFVQWGDPNEPMGHPFRTWYPLIPRSANETQETTP